MHTIVRPHRVVDHIVEHLAAIDEDYVFGVDGANLGYARVFGSDDGGWL
jgi:hypothetical protein